MQAIRRICAIALFGTLLGLSRRASGDIVRAWEATFEDSAVARSGFKFSTLKSAVLLDGSIMVVGSESAGVTATHYSAQGGVLGIVVLSSSPSVSSRVDIDPFGVVAATGVSEGSGAVFLFDGLTGASLWPRPFVMPPHPGAQDVLVRLLFTGDGDVIALSAYGPAYDWDVGIFRLARGDGSQRWTSPAILSLGSLYFDGLDRAAMTPSGDVAVIGWADYTLRLQVFDGGSGAPRWSNPFEYTSLGMPISAAGDPKCDRAGNVFLATRGSDDLFGPSYWLTLSLAPTGAERWRAKRPSDGSAPGFLLVDGEGRSVVVGEGAGRIIAIRYSSSGAPGPEIDWPAPPQAFTWQAAGAFGETDDEVILFGTDDNFLWATRWKSRTGTIAWSRMLSLSLQISQGDPALPQILADQSGSLTITGRDGSSERINAVSGGDTWASIVTVGGQVPAPATPQFVATRPGGDVIAAVGGSASELWRLEGQTGALAGGWPVFAQDFSSRAMALDLNGDAVLLGLSSSLGVVLMKVDGETGMPKWGAPLALGELSSTGGSFLLAADSSGDFFVSGQGVLGAQQVVKVHGADGSRAWSVPYQPQGTLSGLILGRALVPDANGNVDVSVLDPYTTHRAFVMKFQGSDGASLWTTPFAVDGGGDQDEFIGLVSETSGAVYVASPTRNPPGSQVYRLWRLDAASGVPAWTIDLPAPPVEDSLALGALGDLFIAERVPASAPSTSQDYAINRLSTLNGSALWPQPVILPGDFPGAMSVQILTRPNGNAVIHTGARPPATFELDATGGAVVWGPLPGEAFDSSSNIALTPDGVVVQFGPKIVRFTTAIAIDVGAARLPPANCGVAYSFAAIARNAVPPFVWDIPVGALPPGVTLDTSTGTLSGSSSSTGAHPFRLRVRDAIGAVAERDLSLEVVCDGTVSIVGASTTLCGGPGATLSIPGSWASYEWMPGGESTPTLAVNPHARSTYGVVVTDSNGCTSRGRVDIDVVSAPAPVVTAPAMVVVGERGVPASVPTQSGGQYGWLIEGGMITAGFGTSAITFTAGSPGTLWLSVSETDAAVCSTAPGYASVLVGRPSSTLHTLAPCRALDTRQPSDGPRLRSNETRVLAVAGRCGIPATAQAVVFNVTSVQPDAAGAVVVLPGDASGADVNTVSFRPGQTRAAAAIVPLSLDGTATIAIRNDSPGGVDVLLDVAGWFE